MSIKKVLVSLISFAVLIATLCGCGLYNKEYISVNDYVMPTPGSILSSDKVTVSNLSELKKAIQSLVDNGSEHGTIAFSESYSGEPSQDIADACWQVRSQDALCAFCVANISYDLSKILSYYEASVTVSYANNGVPFEDIRQIKFSSGLNDLIDEALGESRKKLVVLVDSCGYTADNVISLVEQSYFSNPAMAPKQPKTAVRVYSGTGYQKLYDISLNYGLSEEVLEEQKLAIQSYNPFDGRYDGENAKMRAVVKYLSDNCTISDEDSIYSVLVEKNGNAKSIALATEILCNKLGLDCIVVNGQKNYQDHFWNMIKINGNYYHFDPCSVIDLTEESVLLRSDSDMWNEYRWDTSLYPRCNGVLSID